MTSLLYTSMERIAEHGACTEQLERLRYALRAIYPSIRSRERVSYVEIAELIGLDDALWLTRVEHRYWRSWRRLAVMYAARVAPLADDARLKRAMATAEMFGCSDVSLAELREARIMAHEVASDGSVEPRASVGAAVLAGLSASPRVAAEHARRAARYLRREDEERCWQRKAFLGIVGA
jgi:hypothetical protein